MAGCLNHQQYVSFSDSSCRQIRHISSIENLDVGSWRSQPFFVEVKAVIFGGIFKLATPQKSSIQEWKKRETIEISEDEPVDFTRFFVVGNVKVSELCGLESCRVLYLGAVGGRNVNRLVV